MTIRLRTRLLTAALVATAPAVAGAQPAHAPARELFLFLFRPGPAWAVGRPMARQDLRAHAAYHAALVREGRAVAGGGYVDMDGGLAIVRAADLSEARAMLAADPAIRTGVFTADVRHWRPRFYSDRPLVDAPQR